ncbi:MAG TPA: neutral/alkaline non-lysosomal ceramidase N-terminal domain-containing protein [Bacteroidales bacterium]|nr:neutral/alkaline non-lysosomal ceramidase N-terminal domain-containing protein [Bacteroidales bacterium]
MKSRAFLFSVFIMLSPFLAQGQSGPGTLKAGFSKIDITPSAPVMLYGYASRKTPSEGVHDPLFLRITMFENGGRKVLFVSSDLGSYPAEVFTVIRNKLISEYSFNESEIFISTIHTHSSPILTLNSETGFPANVSYTEWLSGKLVSAVGDAIKNLKPVTVIAGIGYSPVGSNRRETRSDGTVTLGRNPYGVTDKEVLVLKIASPEGKAIGAMFDYATHSTSLGASNLRISGDVLGLSAQFVEKILGQEVISPVFAGASGNIDPWYRVLPTFNEEPGWIPEPVLLGTLLGEEVVTVFRGIRGTGNSGPIATLTKIVECPRRMMQESSNAATSNQSSTVPVTITAARIGDVAFIGFNVEMLTEIGLKIKAGSPFQNTFIITHCNGSSGYLPPLEVYKEGGYEVTSTRFETGSAEMVIKEAISMLHDL